MKKTLVSVIAIAAMIMGLAGCDLLSGLKKNANDQDSKSWSGQSHKVVDGRKAEVDIEFSDVPTWSLWTYTNGQVLDPQPTNSTKDKTVTYKFPSYSDYAQLNGTTSEQTKTFVLYVSTSDETKDNRGRITVYRDEVVTTKKNAPETIAAVGVLTITNNEPSSTSAYPTGDYTIVDIWPLDPKEADKTGAGDKYVVNDNMVFNKINIASNNSISFPVKAGSQIVGLYQPNRSKNFKVDDAGTYYNLATAESIINDKIYLDNTATRADILELNFSKYATLNETTNKYVVKDADSAKKIQEMYVKANSKIIFGKAISVSKHPTSSYTSVNSSDFGATWFVKKASGNIEKMKVVSDEIELFANTGAIEK